MAPVLQMAIYRFFVTPVGLVLPRPTQSRFGRPERFDEAVSAYYDPGCRISGGSDAACSVVYRSRFRFLGLY
jgi:hypothetical protein